MGVLIQTGMHSHNFLKVLRAMQPPLLSDAERGEGAQETPHHIRITAFPESLAVSLLLLGCVARSSLPFAVARSDEITSAPLLDSTLAHTKELALNRTLEAQYPMMDMFGDDDEFVDELFFDRVLKASPFHHVRWGGLDNATLGKPRSPG